MAISGGGNWKAFYERALAAEQWANITRILGMALLVFGGFGLVGAVVGYLNLNGDDSIKRSFAIAWGVSSLFAATIILAIGAVLMLLSSYVLLRVDDMEHARIGETEPSDEETFA